MMRDLRSPRGPVVRRVLAPEVELVADALLAEQAGELPRALERASRVLPLALAGDQEQIDLAAQPVEVVAVQVLDVVGGVVEVDGVATIAARHDGDVVDAALADREWEELRVPEREVRGVV